MKRQEAYNTITKYLSLYDNKIQSYPTSGEQLAYQNGILVALLMHLIQDDFYARGVVTRLIDKDKKR